jgi:hypothetical protein
MGRPKKPESEMLVEMPCRVPPDVAREIAAIAYRTHRTKGAVCRLLLMRGFNAYHSDGILVEDEEPSAKAVSVKHSATNPQSKKRKS